MNFQEHDVVRVKNTVRVEEMFHGDETEIKAGWEGTIVANADTPTPTVEFTCYGAKPFLAFLEVKNLEKV